MSIGTVMFEVYEVLKVRYRHATQNVKHKVSPQIMLGNPTLVQYYFSFRIVTNEECDNNFKEDDSVEDGIIHVEAVAINATCEIDMKGAFEGQPEEEEERDGCYDDGQVQPRGYLQVRIIELSLQSLPKVTEWMHYEPIFRFDMSLNLRPYHLS